MTREEIENMVPGPEMDRLVSREVMWFTTYEDFQVHAIYTGSPTPTSFRPWQPSINIAAAWEIVEKITKGEYEFQILKAPYYDNDVWLVTISKCIQTEDGLTKFFQETVEATTAPEAICKAALIAVMEG